MEAGSTDLVAMDIANMDISAVNQKFSDTMIQNEVIAKENRLLDSYIHRKVGDINWDELQREVSRAAVTTPVLIAFLIDPTNHPFPTTIPSSKFFHKSPL